MTARVAPAWLLEYGGTRFAAFALHSTLALLENPAFDFIPGAPRHCLGLLRWGGRRLPLLDLGILDISADGQVDEPPAHALVMAWRDDATGEHAELGAIAAPRGISMIEVSDATKCAAPQDTRAVSLLSYSWFEHAGHPVAVIDTARLFSGWLGATRAAAPLI